MTVFQVHSIGTIRSTETGSYIELDSRYRPALQALEGFSHLEIVWWFSDFDNEEARSVLEVEQPYKKAPEKMGIFSTRSPIRPNPIALTTVEVLHIDAQKGIIQVAYIDANDNTSLLDIKPYTPSLDRVENPKVPDWCSHWPMSLEASGEFEWGKEFNF